VAGVDQGLGIELPEVLFVVGDQHSPIQCPLFMRCPR
jgi:hypothetical protein